MRTAIPTWTTRYEAAIAELEAKGVTPIVATPPPSFENGAFTTRYDAVAAAVREVAGRGRPILDIAARWRADGAAVAATYYVDTVHQSEAGPDPHGGAGARRRARRCRRRMTVWTTGRESRRPPIRLVLVGVLAVIAVVELYLVVGKALDYPRFAMLGRDYNLYMDATRRWLGGGPFYLPEQLAGPYDLPWGQILYPPQALALFVPFAALGDLGAALFILIPATITATIVWSWRPGFWAWFAMLVLLVLHPDAPLIWIAGTPTIWVVALVALATRIPWVSAFIWFKPSVFPFALIGIRDRRWWIVTGLFALSAVALWPMMRDWLTAVLNARGDNSGLLYSLSPTALADPLIPIIAWLGRRRPKTPLETEPAPGILEGSNSGLTRSTSP